ncbi:MAG TPA: 2-aminoethylphosphonate--pyruvate transaminase [Anaerolineae bacterium]|nr:2-aminoethylphosphonate--pyruvate transaminase [Anaerolineae bacterium]
MQANQKLLFTPGPLTTSPSVKEAMLRDLGSRDAEFMDVVSDIRRSLLKLGGVAEAGYETIIMQGSGTFGLEAVFSSVTPPQGHWLIIVNGVYGRRLVQIAERLGLTVTRLDYPEDARPVSMEIEAALLELPAVTHLALVHCETSTGMLNPVPEVGELARRSGKLFFVDAMSSFGAVPLNLAEAGIDYLVSSANKCIEGVPGFSFVLARREALLTTQGYARSLSLDLLAQWQTLEATGQFRFTPPTHALLAFDQALRELNDEGGVAGRAARYSNNYETLVTGMRRLGFTEYLAPELQGYIITAFRYPEHPHWNFERFYQGLNQRGFVIYPGKVSNADCFRIGNIGRIFETDIYALLAAIEEVLGELEVEL